MEIMKNKIPNKAKRCINMTWVGFNEGHVTGRKGGRVITREHDKQGSVEMVSASEQHRDTAISTG